MLRKDIEREANSAAIRTGRKVQNGRGREVSMNMWMTEGKQNAKHPPGNPAKTGNGMPGAGANGK